VDPYAYHFDLRAKPLGAGADLDARLAYLERATAEPSQTNPVTVVQLALGGLQLRDPAQLPLVAAAVEWLERTADDRGLLAYRFPMPHTFPLEAPWYSSLAQGEAGSLLVRAAQVLGRGELFDLADLVVEPLLGTEPPLVSLTAEGPVLEEYPTDPPAHVLNGWITSLFGLYDVAHAPRDATAPARKAGEAFEAGTATLAARLHLYRTPFGWSRYDLYPHPLVHAASPFYHRLHVEQLRALNDLAPDPRLAATAERWSAGSANPVAIALGTAHKIAFRLVRPRRQHALARRSPRT